MSEHPKVPQLLSDPISENLKKLAALFPSAVKDGELDIEALCEELGDFAEIQPGDEKYELNWVGKQVAKKKAFEPLLGKTLALKNDGKNADTTQNIYIEGDNLEALKLLRQNYYGEVKMIYIDPPYNTGKDFVYTDKFAVSQEESEEEEGALSESGERLVKNEKSSNRFHARWLDMMYPRLRLAKDLLHENGSLFLSIDDNEVHNLREICDEIFGAENFVSTLTVENNPKGRKNARFVSVSCEFLLIYAKNRSLENSSFKENIPKDPTKIIIDSDGRAYTPGKRVLVGESSNPAVTDHESRKHYSVYWHKERNELKIMKEIDTSNTGDQLSSEGYTRYISTRDNVFIENTYTQEEFLKLHRDNRLLFKDRTIYEKDLNVFTRIKSLLNSSKSKEIDVKTETAKKFISPEIRDLFENPKNPKLIELLITLRRDSSDIILDFFSGSATTAHAVMQLNAEDGGSRKHIMVQLPEVCDVKSEAAKAGYKTIAEIGKERIRRAGEKIVTELRAKKAELEKKGELKLDDQKETNPYILNPDALDIGFKSFRIEDTKINWLKKDLHGEEFDFDTADISDKDALDFVPGTNDHDAVYELMLRQSNIPLTLPITQPVSGTSRTYLYGDAYLICLEEEISNTLVASLAALEPTPLKYFFRDSAFGKDIAFKDETFRRLNAEIAKNTADQADAYTVEFI
jgi:adenine-specific DNA-methyltransferase